MPRARFFFDAGSGGVLWPIGVEDQQIWGYPAHLDALPISSALKDRLAQLVRWYDTSLNWDYPPDPGPWRKPEYREFNGAVQAAVDRLRAQLGRTWEVVNEFDEVHEDPDLARYLADPAHFQR